MKACPNPWCKGGMDDLLFRYPTPEHKEDDRIVIIECQSCGLHGPKGTAHDSAVAAWDDRPEALTPKPAEACNVCLGEPLASGKECVCRGEGTHTAEVRGLRLEIFALQAKDAGRLKLVELLGEALEHLEPAAEPKLIRDSEDIARDIRKALAGEATS